MLLTGLDNRRPDDVIERDIRLLGISKSIEEFEPTQDVPLASLIESPFQRRAALVEEEIETLAASIQENGVITPIVVRECDDGGFELITGHRRTAACRRIGRETIPAIVRVMTDRDAAIALTSDNTQHKNFSDWELYKHAQMLLNDGHVRRKKDLEPIFAMSHAAVFNILAFGELPDEAQAMLDINPRLIGGGVAFALKDASKLTPSLVVEAFKLVMNGKLKQTAIKQWIENKAAPAHRSMPASKYEFSIGDEGSAMCLIVTGTDVRMSGVELHPEKLAALIREHFESLKL